MSLTNDSHKTVASSVVRLCRQPASLPSISGNVLPLSFRSRLYMPIIGRSRRAPPCQSTEFDDPMLLDMGAERSIHHLRR